MKFFRNALVALTPFAFGLLIGLAVIPGDGVAAAQADQTSTVADRL